MTIYPPARGPSPLFRQFMPALLLACFAAVLFWWNPFGPQPDHAYFEALVRPTVAGETELIANVDGSGLRKEYAMVQPVKPGEINHVRFALRAGKLGEFRFSPLTTVGEVDLYRCWISSERGDLIASMTPANLASSMPGAVPIGQDGAVRLPSRLGFVTTGLEYKAESAIDLAAAPPPPFWQIALVFVGTLAGVMAWSKVAGRIAWRNHLAPIVRWAHRHPRAAILTVAMVSVTFSCFPVIFCGKSFVSPDNGVQLLYERFPSVPGAAGGRVENPAGGDMGATFYWHLPASIVQHRALFENGEFPLWNRYNWCGVALWAQCMSMFGDPLHWPAVLTGGAAWAWDFKFVVAKILFAFGIGLLVRVTSRSLSASLLLTLSAPFIGFFAYRFNHPGFFALCYAPWILLPWLEAARAQTRREVAAWAALLIFADWWQLNSGTAKEATAFLLFLNATGALALLRAPISGSERLARAGLFIWANLLFVLLAAPLWLTFIEALGKSWTTYDQPRVCQIQPALLIGLFDDIFYRQLQRMDFLWNPSANFFVLLGAVWAVVRLRALSADPNFLAALVGVLGAAAVTFGVVSPDVLAQVPLIRNIFHFDDTFSSVLFVLLFIIAGFGVRECLRRMRHPEWRGDWLLAFGIIGVLCAAYFGFTQAAHRDGKTFLAIGHTIPKSEFFWQYGVAIVIAVGLLPWAWRVVRLRQSTAPIWFLVALAAFTTLHFRHGMYLVTGFDLYTMNPKKRLDLREISSPAVRQVQQVMHEPARVSGIDWIMTGINVPPRFEVIDGADALQNPALRDLTTALGLKAIWSWRILVLRQDFASVHRALDLLGVRYFLDKRGRGSELPGVRLLGTSDLDVLESETAWPRAFFTDSVLVYHELPEMVRLVQEGDGRPFAAMLPADRAHVSLPQKDFAQRQIVPAHNYTLTQNSTTFEIDAPSAGVAVLGEAWVPRDIQAFVDGQPAQVLRTDHAFRGVFIEKAGHHRVEFRYWPAVLDTSLWLTLCGALGVLGTSWVFARQSPARDTVVTPAPPTPSPIGHL